jgi:two-component system sensor kinase FixL
LTIAVETLEALPALPDGVSTPRRLGPAALIGLGSVALGVAVIFGWLLDSDELTSIAPGLVPMKPTTAIGFILVGLSLLVAAATSTDRWRAAGRLLAAGAAVIGLVTLAEYALGMDLWVDHLLPFAAIDKTGLTLPARMAPTTAALLVAVAVVIGAGSRGRPARGSDLVLLAVTVVSLLSLVPYVFGVRSFMLALGPLTMALHTTVAFLLLMLGAYLLWPGQGALGAVTAGDRAARAARALLIIAFAIPVGIGWLAIRGRDAGLYEVAFGLAFLVIVTIFMLLAGILVASRVLSRRDAELAAALHSTEQSLALVTAVLEGTTEVVMIRDRDGRFILANPAASAFLGHPTEQLVGRLVSDVFGPVVGARMREEDRPVIEEALTVASDVTAETALGPRIYRRITSPYRNNKGRIVGLLSIAHDITEREALTQDLRRQRVLLELLHAVSVAANAASDLRAAGAIAIEAICGHAGWAVGHLYQIAADGSLVSDDVWRLEDDDRDAAFRTASQRDPSLFTHGLPGSVARSGTHEYLAELETAPGFRRRSAAQQSGLRSAAAFPILAGERVAGVLEFFSRRDEPISKDFLETMRLIGIQLGRVAEREAAAEALRRSDEDHRRVTDLATDMFIRVDQQGVVQEWNEAATRVLGWTQAEIVGRRAVETFVPEQTVAQFAATLSPREGRAMNEIIERRLQSVVRRRDGTEVPVEISVWPTESQGETLYNAFMTDIGERLRAEAELRRVAEELRRSNRELQDFAAVASHDLQEPLRKIRTFADRLATRQASMDPQAQDYVARMESAAERMQSLIDGLLSYSRVTTSRPFGPVMLGEIVHEVLADLEAPIDETGAVVRTDSLPTIDADGLQMRQLFQNVIGNALKYRHAGVAPEIHLTSHATIELDDPGGPIQGVRIEVADNGIGFEQRYAERIFGQFQRLHGRGEYEGTGMGLAICRKIVERHGGSIVARSEPGHGATITIELPVRQRAHPRPESGAPVAEAAAA